MHIVSKLCSWFYWPVGLVVASRTVDRVLFDSQVGQKVLLGFSIRNFSETVRNLGVGGIAPPCLGKYVKPLVLRRISPWFYRIAVPSDYESSGRGTAPWFADTLVHYNISCVHGSALRLAAVAGIGLENTCSWLLWIFIDSFWPVMSTCLFYE